MQWVVKHRVAYRLRMYTGWILFFYACTHLLNHAMGIFGIETIEAARLIFLSFWRLPILEWVVTGSFLVHFTLVIAKLFRKQTYRGLSFAEWLQIIFGFYIVNFLIHHIIETKILYKVFGIVDSYTYYLYWLPPIYHVIFVLSITVTWAHGALGLRSYLKQKLWYPRWQPWLAGAAVGLPILASWGIYTVLHDINILSRDTEWVSALEASSNPAQIDIVAWQESWQYEFSGAYLAFLLLFVVTRKFVIALRQKRKGIQIRYPDGTAVSVPRGTSLLEASLQANIPHAHVCGGRGRCSTCRVQVIEGLEHLPPMTQDEEVLLKRVNCGDGIRLACRTRPVANCTVYPLLLSNVTLQQSLWKKHQYHGIDRNVAILFADLRGFTAMAEDRLPYDIVFLLNQYFQFMGHAIETHHGRVDKFIGDAIMAVFGMDGDEQQACRNALAAARSMRIQLDRLNDQLRIELATPLCMGFGIHFGHVIIGEMGYKNANNLVAIGDATNTASRLESLCKDFNCELVVSKAVIDTAGLDFSGYRTHTAEVRGRMKPVPVYLIENIKGMAI